MTREEKCELALSRGFKYDEETGFIYGSTGKHITKVTKNGYILMSICKDYKKYYLYGHQFAFYVKYGKVVKCIDHRNRIKTDNRISNLREVSKQENAFNMSNVKGFSFDKRSGKWVSNIMVNGKKKHLGSFSTPIEAKNKYLKQKLKYHTIKN